MTTNYGDRSGHEGPVSKGNIAIKTPPTLEPLTRAEAKNYLRIDSTDDDTLIDGFIKSARQYCEKFQNRIYIETVLTFSLNRIPGMSEEIQLPYLPLVSVDSITIKQKGTDLDVEIDSDMYDVDLESGKIVFNSDFDVEYDSDLMPTYNCLVIEFTAGYGDAAADVPETVKQAMLLILDHWNSHRAAVTEGNKMTEVPLTADALLQQDRIFF
jgi:uncharacterized phiE125 gp8 family phage protein